jgi:hypothetical protein
MPDARPYTIGWDDEELQEGSAVVEELQDAALSSACKAAPEAARTAPAEPPKTWTFRPPAAQLPRFPRHHLRDHFPAFFARSGLFAAGRVLSKEAEGSTKVLAQGKGWATLSGRRLSLVDKMVFEAIVTLAKDEALELHEPLQCSVRAIAREMGWGDKGGANSRHIEAVLERFARTTVTFDLGDGVPRTGKLLASVAKAKVEGKGKSDGERTKTEIVFDAGFILPAFGATKQYKIDRRRRKRLCSSMSKWLHDFLSTHSKPFALDLKYLRERSGFLGRPKDFAEALTAAADEIMEKAPELLACYEFDHRARSSEGWKVVFHRGSEAASFNE